MEKLNKNLFFAEKRLVFQISENPPGKSEGNIVKAAEELIKQEEGKKQKPVTEAFEGKQKQKVKFTEEEGLTVIAKKQIEKKGEEKIKKATGLLSLDIGPLKTQGPEEITLPVLKPKEETPVEAPKEEVKVVKVEKPPQVEKLEGRIEYSEGAWLEKAIREAGKKEYPYGGIWGAEAVSGDEFAWREFKKAYAKEKRVGGLKTGQQIEDFQRKWFEKEFGKDKDLYAEAAKLKENEGAKTIVEITRPLRVGPVDLINIHEENFINLFRGIRHEFALKFDLPAEYLTNATIVDLYAINDDNIPGNWGYKGDSIEFNPADGYLSFLNKEGPPPLAVIKPPEPVKLAEFKNKIKEKATA